MKMHVTDVYKVNRYVVLAIELVVYTLVGYFIYFTKQHFYSGFLLLPIVGGAFYAGIVGGMLSCFAAIALIVSIQCQPLNYAEIFIFVAVALHTGVTTDILKNQMLRYQLQAEQLAHKTSALQEKSKTVSALREIDNSILLGAQLKSTLNIIAKMLADSVKAKGCIVFLKKAREIKPFEAFGIDTKSLKFEPGKPLVTDALKSKKIVIVQDYISDSRTCSQAKIARDLGFNSAICFPMVLDNKAIGGFLLTFKHKFVLNDKKVEELTTFVNQATIAFQTQQLIENLSNLSLETIEALVRAIEARDPYTAGHSDRVTNYAVSISREMRFSPEEQKLMRYASLLHDIGKLGVDHTIVNKPSILSKEELEQMRKHVILSDLIIKPIKFLEPMRSWVYHHQEKYDGSGYPDGIKGNKIPLGARIISVADAYDAMTSNRPYRDAMTPLDAIEELKTKSGSQFDPKVVKAFLKIFEKEVA